MFRVRVVLAGAAVLAVIPLVSAAQVESLSPAASSSELHRRALAAIPSVREGLDGQLNDYPSARFRNVRARIARSVYASDEGQSNKVPWTHRGGPILVFCGEINPKNRMGGYGGWRRFVFQPTQTDMVAMYDHGTPRTLTQVNVAARNKLVMSGNDRFDDEEVVLLCGTAESSSQMISADLSDIVKHPGS